MQNFYLLITVIVTVAVAWFSAVYVHFILAFIAIFLGIEVMQYISEKGAE